MKHTLYAYTGLIFLSLIFSFSVNPLWIPENEPLAISDFTNSILHRYYFIARVEKNIEILRSTSEKEPIHFNIPQNLISYFSQQEILHTLRELHEKKSFEPLWALWDEILSYKYINNAVLITEFTRLLYIVMHTIYNVENNKAKEISHNDNHVATADITYRFYLIKRLSPLMQRLNTFKYYKPALHTLNNEWFNHGRIRTCLHALKKQKNLLPLLGLLEEFQQFKYCNDMLFAREYLVLLLAFSKELACSEDISKQVYLYDDLSMEELLHSIDIMTTKLPQTSISPKNNKSYTLLCTIPFLFLVSATIYQLLLSLFERSV